MKKKFKLFCTIATLCLSLAVLVFGVYSSISFTYTSAGLLNYEVENTYVEIETRVFSTSKRYKNTTDLKIQSQIFENSNFETLNSMSTLDVDYTFNKVQIQNLNQSEDYVVQESDFVDTYSSVANPEPPEDLDLNLTYSTTNKVFTYFVVTKITNKSTVPVYAYVPTTGEDMYVAPENSHMYKMSSYKEMTNQDDSVYIVFAMAIDDITTDIIDSPYVFPIVATLDMQSMPDNVIAPADVASMGIEADVYVPGEEVTVSTSAKSPSKLTIPTPTVNETAGTSTTYMDFTLPESKTLLKTNLYSETEDYITLSFNFGIYFPEEGITEEMNMYEFFCMMNETTITEDEYITEMQPMILASLRVYNDSFDSTTKTQITETDGLKLEIFVDSETMEEVETLSIPKSLLTNGAFSLEIFGNEESAFLGLYVAIISMNGGSCYISNLYTNVSGLTTFNAGGIESVKQYLPMDGSTYSIGINTTVDSETGYGYAIALFSLYNLPENAYSIELLVKTNIESLMFALGGKQRIGNILMDNNNGLGNTSFTVASEFIVNINLEEYFHKTSSLVFMYNSTEMLLFDLTLMVNEKDLFNYELNSDGTEYSIVSIDENYLDDFTTTLEIPSEYKGLPVTQIKTTTTLENVTELVIPSSITTIEHGAFANSLNLKKVVFEDGCTKIGSSMFNGCTNLSEVVIPSTMQSIENYAFAYTALNTITIPSGKISQNTFNNCDALEEIYIGENVTYISNGIAQYCYNLKKLVVDENNATYDSRGNTIVETATGTLLQGLSTSTIEDGVKIIKTYSFYNGSPTTIIIPSSVTQIDYSVGYRFDTVYIEDLESWVKITHNVTSYNYPSNPLYNAKKVYINNELVTNLVIPDTISTINAYAFYGCQVFKSVEIPSSVTSIGTDAFAGCLNLLQVKDLRTSPSSSNFPTNANMEYINSDNFTSEYKTEGNYYTFTNGETKVLLGLVDSNVEEITDLGNYNITVIDQRVFYQNTKLRKIIIPEGVVSIGSYAFYECYNLTTLSLPSSLETIGSSAFVSCPKLVQVLDQRTGDNVTKITSSETAEYITSGEFTTTIQTEGNYYTYINGESKYLLGLVNENVTEITDLSDYNFTNIYSYAFYKNPNIEKIIIPQNIKSLNGYMFYECVKLKTVEFETGTQLEVIGNYVFTSCTSLTTLAIPNSVKELGAGLFKDCTSLTNFVLHNGITKIGSSAFQNCVSLKSITIPSGVTSLYSNTFYECKNLTNVVLNEGLLSIDSGCFGKSGIVKLEIPSTVKTLGGTSSWSGSGVFYNCEGLNEIKFAKNSQLKSIGTYVFFGSSLQKITLPASLQTIGENAFYKCSNLKIVKFEENSQLTTIGEWAFYDSALEEIEFTTSLLTRIETRTFAECKNLKSITIPASVTYIGDTAFQKCISLETLKFEENSQIDEIWIRAFDECYKLKDVVLPASLTGLYGSAFEDCFSMGTITINSAITKTSSDSEVDIIQNMYIDAIYVPDDSVSSIKSLINGNADFIKPISQKPA